MVILHIARSKNYNYNGVHVVVPKHVEHQAEFATVGFINILNVKINGANNQIDYKSPFKIENLPTPFNKPDLVVFHEVYWKTYLQIGKNLKQNNIPYIIIPHGTLTQGAQKKKWLKKKVANFLLFNRFINGAAAIQCLSERELEATLFGKNKFIGTNGIEIPNICKHTFNDDKINFTYIGRLDPNHKGLDLMIKAIALKEEILFENKCEFSIYGPDQFGYVEKLNKLLTENLTKELVKLNSALYGEEKEQTLLNSDIFIQTSRFEGMPMGILEALSYGIPCLVTKGTGLGDLIQKYDAGWVAETNAEDIARVLTVAIQEKTLYPQKGANARRLVEENFSWSTVAKSTIEKYQSLIYKNMG